VSNFFFFSGGAPGIWAFSPGGSPSFSPSFLDRSLQDTRLLHRPLMFRRRCLMVLRSPPLSPSWPVLRRHKFLEKTFFETSSGTIFPPLRPGIEPDPDKRVSFRGGHPQQCCNCALCIFFNRLSPFCTAAASSLGLIISLPLEFFLPCSRAFSGRILVPRKSPLFFLSELLSLPPSSP